MLRHIVTPVDGSPESWRGATAAIDLARKIGVSVTAMTVVLDAGDRAAGLQLLERSVADEPSDVEVGLEVSVADGSVAAAIEQVVRAHPGSFVVMASHGRGRSAAIVGSIADDVIHRLEEPVLLVGPHVIATPFDGPVVITVDGSDEAERGVPVGVEWAARLRCDPWIVHAGAPDTALPVDTLETGYVSALAHRFRKATGRHVEFEEVHGHRPTQAITSYATSRNAALIVTTTHARTGFDRLAVGSVAAGIVRHAHCPVLVVHRPDHEADD